MGNNYCMTYLVGISDEISEDIYPDDTPEYLKRAREKKRNQEFIKKQKIKANEEYVFHYKKSPISQFEQEKKITFQELYGDKIEVYSPSRYPRIESEDKVKVKVKERRRWSRKRKGRKEEKIKEDDNDEKWLTDSWKKSIDNWVMLRDDVGRLIKENERREKFERFTEVKINDIEFYQNEKNEKILVDDPICENEVFKVKWFDDKKGGEKEWIDLTLKEIKLKHDLNCFEKVLNIIVNKENKFVNILSNRDIISVFGYVKIDDKTIGILKQYKDGHTLFDFLHGNKRYNLTNFEKWHIVKRIVSIVKSCHEKGIVLENISSSNFFISKDKKSICYSLPLFRTEKNKHYCRYLAPELLDTNDKTKKSDVYALGALCYEIITGNLVFHKVLDDFKLLEMVYSGLLPPLNDLNLEFKTIIEWCMKNYSCRISAKQVLQYLNENEWNFMKENPITTESVEKQLAFENIEYIITCPITQEIMKSPVILVETGQTYEHYAISKWLKDHSTCPLTGKKIVSKTLIKNISLKNTIDAWNKLFRNKK